MSGTTPRRSGPGGGALTKNIEMGSTLTTNWASSPVGSESAPHFNMSLWSWVRALTEAKEKGMGHALIACEWDHPSSEWARGGALTIKGAFFFCKGPTPWPTPTRGGPTHRLSP